VSDAGLLDIGLDSIAIIPPLIAILYLYRQKGSSIGLARDNLLRLSIYFLSLVGFDALRDSVQDPLIIGWTICGTIVSLGLVMLSFGHMAAVVNYCPDVRTLKESLSRLLRPSITNGIYHTFNMLGIAWVIGSIIAAIVAIGAPKTPTNSWLGVMYVPPPWYVTFTTSLMVPLIMYPSVLLLLAISRAKVSNVRTSLVLLLAGWLSLPTSQLVFLVQIGSSPLPTQIGLVASSLFFILCAIAVSDKSGIIHVLTSQLTPQPMLKGGQRYLVLHDGGKEIISFLAASLQSVIEAGGRIIVNSIGQSSMIEGLTRGHPKFDGWVRSGKIVGSDEFRSTKAREGLSERLNPGPVPLTFVTELGTEDLRSTGFLLSQDIHDKNQPVSELYLMESNKAPRPLLSEFLRNNHEVEVLNLSDTKDTFSNLINLDHQRVQGSKILLEYDSSASHEDVVNRFFKEGASNAELCALFTSKSSKLYRILKGNKMVKVIAASSLVSSMSELSDGEVEIPDRELGLVASIASELLESNKTTNVSIVFDSLAELITGQHWEQTYSGIKQLFELVSVPNSTVIFLGNLDTMDPKLLGAIRSFFSVQLRLGNTGLHPVKLKLI
jgi:aryl carrier-like protein